MHDIKKILNKNNQTIQGVKKIQGEKLSESTIFQNPGGTRAPLGSTWVCPCT
jgi:hypothetical protein